MTITLERVGEFYEAFDDDAERLASSCRLTLTKASSSGRRLCGFPVHMHAKIEERALNAGHTLVIKP